MKQHMKLYQRQPKERNNTERLGFLLLLLAMTAGAVLVLTTPSYYSIISYERLFDFSKNKLTFDTNRNI